MNTQNLDEMIAVGRQDLLNINKYGAKAMVKDTIKKLAGRSTSNRDMLFWPAGMLLLGLFSAIEDSQVDDPLKETVLHEIEIYINTWADVTDETFSYVDDALSGLSMIELFRKTGKDKYLSYAGKLYDFLCNYRKTEEGSIIYNSSAGNDYVFADGAGETAMFLFSYAKITKSETAFLLGAKQLTNYYKYGFDFRSSLPYHAFSNKDNKKLGLLGWGRACGWLLMGYSEVFDTIKLFSSDDKENDTSLLYKELVSQYLTICDTVISYQRPDGGFSWHLPAIGGEPDTSASAMIGLSLVRGINANVFGKKVEAYKNSARRLVDFISNHCEKGSVGGSLSGCEDLGVHRQIYGHYPWGQGAAMALISIYKN